MPLFRFSIISLTRDPFARLLALSSVLLTALAVPAYAWTYHWGESDKVDVFTNEGESHLFHTNPSGLTDFWLACYTNEPTVRMMIGSNEISKDLNSRPPLKQFAIKIGDKQPHSYQAYYIDNKAGTNIVLRADLSRDEVNQILNDMLNTINGTRPGVNNEIKIYTKINDIFPEEIQFYEQNDRAYLPVDSDSIRRFYRVCYPD